jgi:serine/threonine-protein kinase
MARLITHRCLVCGENAPGGSVPPDCPAGGGHSCALIVAEEEPGGGDSALEETAAFEPGSSEPDGWPEADDLETSAFGQYEVETLIGRGSMGRVYRATHRGLRRRCALKVMNPGLVQREPVTVEQFWAEARAVAGLVHPHIVTVHNLGTERDYHFIEMEYVPGGVSLTERVVREGPMPPDRATTLVRQVAQALEAAHRAGLVHRDVKPANVLMTPEGVAKLADFGLVRRRADRLAAVGALAGTPSFMAPELFGGSVASAATDLYAVGVMYYYLLTARLPYVADRVAKLIPLHQGAPIPDVRELAEVPDEVAGVLSRLLAKRPEGRPESAAALADELKGVLTHLHTTEELLLEALDGLGGLTQQTGREQFRVVFPVPGDRVQEVYLDATPGRTRERLLTIFSVCGPAQASHHEYALRLNATLTHGSLSIREVNGQPMFVMSKAFPRASVTAAEVRAAVQEIAKHSDRVERELSPADLF